MINKINYEKSINVRRSARSFFPDSVEEEKKRELMEYIETLTLPFEHSVEVRLFEADQTKKLYTIMESPRDNLAFISDTDFVSISKAGFVGELAILKATDLGLSTCWYGHYHLKELERVMPHLGRYINDKNPWFSYGKGPVEGRRVISITPFAYYKKKGARLMDRYLEATVSFKRKDLSLLINKSVDSLPEELLFALDLARKAPSAGNGQFWRFNISEDNRSIEIAMPVGYKHPKWEHPNVDIGICASHFWVGLELKGIKSEIEVFEDQDRAVWRFRLV